MPSCALEGRSHHVFEVRAIELRSRVGARALERTFEAGERIASSLDVRKIRGKHADLGRRLLDDPTCRLGGIRCDPDLAGDVFTRLE